MAIKTSNENVCINRIISQKQESFTVEGDEIVPDIKPDILNIISTSGNICIYKKEIQDGKAKIDGVINVYALYLADDENGSIRCINSSLDFSKTIDIDETKQDMQLEQRISIQSIDTKILNGRKINIKAILNLNICIYSNEEIEILKNIEDIPDMQTLNKSCYIHSLVGKGNTIVYAKDTIKIDKLDNLLEIIKVKTNIINQETKISYNKVLVKANMSVKVVYLTEDNRIGSTTVNIPIMGFIDIQNINENNMCDVSYQLKNLNIKPNNMEEHSIYIDTEVDVNCMVYDNKEIRVIEDLYSPSREIDYTQRNIIILKDKKRIEKICNISNNEKISEIGKNKIYDVEVQTNILGKKIMNGRVIYNGEINANFLFGTPEELRVINSKLVTIPFEFNIDEEQIKSDSNIETNIEIVSQDFSVMLDESIDMRIDLKFDLSILDTEKIKIISDVEENQTRIKESYSIVIYYTKPGDTLWNIAKRFGSTVEEIVKINNIENENKIIVGEQLFIPR